VFTWPHTQERRREHGRLDTPSLTRWEIVKFTAGWMFRHELTNTIKMILEVILIAGASIAKPLLLSYIFDIYIPEKDYARCTYAVIGVVVMMLAGEDRYRPSAYS